MSDHVEELKNSALILIDVINDLEFPDNDYLIKQMPVVAKNLSLLSTAARRAQIPVIYLNDNFGKWRSDFKETVDYCLNNDVKGREFVRLIRPDKEDYFVLKPMHSGFYGTPLQILLNNLDVTHVVLTGIAGDICVLYTAIDAYMRKFSITIVSDAVASNTEEDNLYALQKIENQFKANIRSTTELLDILQAFIVDPD